MNDNERFRLASEKLQNSVRKHVEEYDESSEEEELSGDVILDNVFQKYDCSENVDKIKELLEDSFRSGGVICLVCISSIRRPHPIWTCKNCFSAFHLNCIRQWANESMQDLEIWNCPKCRYQYPKREVPDIYKCFCGKTIDPEFDPWIVPHSCGKECRKLLSNNCQHTCLLLCHPGPCPPCPQSISVKCNCGKSGPKGIRCSIGRWCCDRVCGKLLSCGRHKCMKTCHDGDCDDCKEVILRPCRCKAHTQQTLCKESDWQCDTVCGKALSCGYHKCEQKCHSLDCGRCPLSGSQRCPCGSVLMDVTCPEDVPSCGGTCNKPLECGSHYCPNKCHKNSCPQCLEIIDKKCRCGTHTKELPCSKEFLCQVKCKNMKACGLHPCNKKCCDGNCPPCTKICGRMLRCGKHKCELSCHLGPCYPCGLNAKLFCVCGKTFKTVPCGTEKRAKPPSCSKCKLPRLCGHSNDKINKHPCHFGLCPKCKEKCNKKLACGHICEEFCHGAVPVTVKSSKPATPWEVREKVEIKALACPPCKHFRPRPCLGGHEAPMMNCTVDPIASCGRLCGRPLKCGRHACAKLCHEIINEDPITKTCEECEECNKQCDIPRPDGCKHPCLKSCHFPPCEPCKVLLKRRCHCEIVDIYVECSSINSEDQFDTEKALSCNQQCSKILSCSHRCGKICHSGECLPISDCMKKTAVYCDCRRLKKMISCSLVSKTEISCDDTCKAIIEEKLKQQHEFESKLKAEEEERNRKEIAEYQRKFGMEKKGRKNKTKIIAEKKSWNKYVIFTSTIILFLAIVVAVTQFNK